VRILLDTHCFLWMQLAPERFSAAALARLEDPATEYVPSRMAVAGVRGLAVEHAHALQVAALPAHHRDPFDRLLVAQAMLEGLPILTDDPQLAQYEVDTIPAR
jgi:PIN domain nuclease of toxin-antitoxin system